MMQTCFTVEVAITDLIKADSFRWVFSWTTWLNKNSKDKVC